jgi:hypothetical protein
MIKVIIAIIMVDIDVIHKHLYKLISPIFEFFFFLHSSRKNVGYILQPEWHYNPLKRVKFPEIHEISGS